MDGSTDNSSQQQYNSKLDDVLKKLNVNLKFTNPLTNSEEMLLKVIDANDNNVLITKKYGKVNNDYNIDYDELNKKLNDLIQKKTSETSSGLPIGQTNEQEHVKPSGNLSVPSLSVKNTLPQTTRHTAKGKQNFTPNVEPQVIPEGFRLGKPPLELTPSSQYSLQNQWQPRGPHMGPPPGGPPRGPPRGPHMGPPPGGPTTIDKAASETKSKVFKPKISNIDYEHTNNMHSIVTERMKNNRGGYPPKKSRKIPKKSIKRNRRRNRKTNRAKI